MSLLNPVLSDPDRYALFLDLDGTLIDLAETPEDIVIPDDLTTDLALLSMRYGGAVAIISGRPVSWINKRLGHPVAVIAGIHGAERNDKTLLPDPVLRSHLDEALHLARPLEQKGVIIEDKGVSLALHYWQVPQLKQHILDLVKETVSKSEGAFSLLEGRGVIEIKPGSANKGRALEQIMEERAFKGRIPIAFGDDVTDEDAFKTARQLNGIAIAVGPRLAHAEADLWLPDANAVRGFIARAAREDVL